MYRLKVFVDCSAVIAEAKLQPCLVSDLCTVDTRSLTGMTGVGFYSSPERCLRHVQ